MSDTTTEEDRKQWAREKLKELKATANRLAYRADDGKFKNALNSVKGDADSASCPRTRKSTTGVVGKLGQHPLNALSATQPDPPALSTGRSGMRR